MIRFPPLQSSLQIASYQLLAFELELRRCKQQSLVSRAQKYQEMGEKMEVDDNDTKEKEKEKDENDPDKGEKKDKDKDEEKIQVWGKRNLFGIGS